MERIETLTPEMEARIPAHRERWLRIGLSTAPADRARAEAGVDLAYRIAGLEPPPLKVWLRSPLEGCDASAIYRAIRDIPGEGWEALAGPLPPERRGLVWGQVWKEVWARTMDRVSEAVRRHVFNAIWEPCLEQITDHVSSQVWERIVQMDENEGWDQPWGPIKEQAGNQFRDAMYVLSDAQWLAMLSFFPEIEATRRMEGLIEIAAASGLTWWWAYEKMAILTERPRKITLNEQRLLHCADGPAVEFPDGFPVWARNGEWISRREGAGLS